MASNLSGQNKDRYDEKVLQCDGVDPYSIKAKDLSLDPKDFPEISLFDITNYMIHKVSPFTKKCYDNYKGTEAYVFFESGFVLSLGSKKTGNMAIVKGTVKHSQRMNNTALKAWVLANMNGEIICAHCNCLAGLSETCSHVGAICFAVKNVAESSESIKSVTDILCKWNVPKIRGVPMSSANEINWRNPSHKPQMIETSFIEYCDSITPLSDDRINEFIRKCHSHGGTTAIETMLHPLKERRKTNLRDEIFLASLYSSDNRNKSLHELVEIGKSILLNISEDEAEEIARLTIPRLKSKCTTALRRGRITGSNFKVCCSSNIKDPAITTIRRVIHLTKAFGDSPSVKFKKKIIDQYIRKIESSHANCTFKECGLLVNPKLPYFSGTPDGLVSCDCHGNGCLKTKYFKNLSRLSLEAMTNEPDNILIKDEDRYSLETSHEFYYHAQLQINITGLKYCDLVIWSEQKAIVLRVNADTEFWNVAMKKAVTFHEEVIMPELLGKFFTERNCTNSLNDQLQEEQLIELEIEFLN